MQIINAHIGQLVLRHARQVIQWHLTGLQGTPEPPTDIAELENCGVFVTLRKQGRLRGCIGTFAPRAAFAQTLADIAIAATRDPRFADCPISPTELPDLRIEVSILSPLRRLEHPLDFERGVHGIHMRCRGATGCFLPDVGIDQGWDRERFLSELSGHKMGLPPDAWRDPQAEISAFTVQKFVESE